MAEAPTAFVTGATGFVGSHLVEELRRQGFGEIRCLVRRELRWLAGLDVVPVHSDLFDGDAIRDAVDGMDYVFHVGAVTRARDWPTFQRENVEATLHLMDAVLDAAPDVRRVVVTSSLAAVGRCPGGVADESTPLNPISRYGQSKAQMEHALAASQEGLPSYKDQLPVVVLRPPSVYGPREADIYTLFKSVKRGIFPLMGMGKRPDISLVHVHDVVRGMVDAAQAEGTVGRTYFLGSAHFYSWREVHAAMCSALQRRALAVPVPPVLTGIVGAAAELGGRLTGTYPPLNREKAREARFACKMCRIDRARADFEYRPRVSLDDGMRETVAWYRANGWL